jgi:hypothetical protein
MSKPIKVNKDVLTGIELCAKLIEKEISEAIFGHEHTSGLETALNLINKEKSKYGNCK